MVTLRYEHWPSTGWQPTEDVRRYELWRSDQRMVLTLAAPAGRLAALDPVIHSFHWRP